MAIAYVQSTKGASSGAVSAQGATLGAAPTAGNTLLAFVSCDTTGRTFTLTSTNATWTATADKIQTSSSGDGHWFSTTAVAASAGTTITATINSGTAFLSVAVYEFSGLVTGSSPLDVTSGASDVTGLGGINVAAGTSGTTSQADALVMGGWMFNNGLNITFAAAGGATAPANAQNLTGASNLCLLSEYKIVSAAGTQTATGTTNDSNGRWAGALATYKAGTVGQLAAPDSDVTGSPTWTTDTGGTTNLYQAIDETTASDTDYIRSVLTPSADTHEVGLANVTDPASSTDHLVRYRIRKQAAGDPIDLTVSLRQGASTQIAAWTESAIGTSFATTARTLSGAEADSITDYTDLRLRFSATQGAPATAPTYVGAGTPLVATVTSGGTMAPTLPAGTAADDIAILVASTASNVDYSDTISGWTKITPGGVAENNTVALRVECWARRLTGSGDAPTVPGLTDGNVRTARIFAVRGCPTSGTVDTVVLANRSNNAASTTVTFPSVAAGSTANTLSALAYVYVTDPSAATTVSGFSAFDVLTTTTGADATQGMGATRTNSGSGTLAGGTSTVSTGTFTSSVNVGLHFVFPPAAVAARANVAWAQLEVPQATGPATYTLSGGGTAPVMTGSGAGLQYTSASVISGGGTAPVMAGSGTGLAVTNPVYTASGSGTVPVMAGSGTGLTVTAPVYALSGAGTVLVPAGSGTGLAVTAPVSALSGSGTAPVPSGGGAGLQYTSASSISGGGTAPVPSGSGTGLTFTGTSATLSGAGTVPAPVGSGAGLAYTSASVISGGSTAPVPAGSGAGLAVTNPVSTISGSGSVPVPVGSGTGLTTGTPVATLSGGATVPEPAGSGVGLSYRTLGILSGGGSAPAPVGSGAGLAVTVPVSTLAGTGAAPVPSGSGAGLRFIPAGIVAIVGPEGAWSGDQAGAWDRLREREGTWAGGRDGDWDDARLVGAWAGGKRGSWQ